MIATSSKSNPEEMGQNPPVSYKNEPNDNIKISTDP